MTATDPAVETTPGVRACLFLLEGERFAIEVMVARELVTVGELTVVPRAPAYLVGVANLRGYVLPVLDVRRLLGLPPRRIARQTRALVIEVGLVQVAIVIDAVLGLTTFDEIIPFGDTTRAQYGEFGVGLLRRGEELITLLDAPKLLEALKTGGKGG